MQAGHVRDVHVGDHHERRGIAALTVVAVALVVAVVVVVVVALVRSPATTSGSAAPETRRAATPGSTPADVPPPSADEPSREVELVPGTGIDLDSDGTEVRRSAGPTGGLDLHMDSLGLLSPGKGVFHEDPGPAASRERCADSVANAPGEGRLIPVVADLRYCFRTTDGRIAWLRTTSTILDPGEPRVVLDVVVW
ncbi:hypothetical protein AB0A74_39665 [Saccharothrix sp. NPDC042600]|uniref:hypothetical protein n=1 Tax=Saccharothrix TaxID=2071 RepID=UPI0033EA5CCA|nr:hypothetical protein GCM10017745_24890 [Saccharothrix mutabilis subsp. capreolus]